MKLSTRILLPVAFALTAGAAFAEGPLQGNEVFNFNSSLTRAEVQAQASVADKAGLIARGEASPSQQTVVAGSLTRAQVQAEAAEAYRLGLVAQGEVFPAATTAQADQIRMAGLRAVQGNALVQAPGANVAN